MTQATYLPFLVFLLKLNKGKMAAKDPGDVIVIYNNPSFQIVLTLTLLLAVLVMLLIFMYKKLNKDTNGQYTIRRMIYKEGGVRDRMRSAAMALESFLGIQLWPCSRMREEAGEEMCEVGHGAGDVEMGNQLSESEAEEEGEEKKEEGDERRVENSSSDDYSSMEGCDLKERAKLKDQWEEEDRAEGHVVRKQTAEKRNEHSESSEDDKCNQVEKVRCESGLLIDLHQFSGSAIWSDESKNEDKGNKVTVL
ncbi:uncharacterized protein si:ch211-119e14.1 [Lampris incognitus]|uniref:uncharacterized protein si:ch211-119e14.1 n=1 Tax=Lampris incognitus TaxID=2546036 RepID=UPI0024B55075|nr:uncharacterized protein si:ch211-119e14.1 [Lampris incognitus]